MSLRKMKIYYPKCVEDIPPERQEELERGCVMLKRNGLPIRTISKDLE